MRKFLPGLIAVLLTLSMMGLFHFYQQLARYFPFDFYWDMDATTTQDVLLYNQGYYPSHLDHPKFGMVMVLANTALLGQSVGLLSTVRLSDLEDSPNPLLGIAELTLFLRQSQGVIIGLSVTVVLLLLALLFPQERWLLLPASLILGYQGGMLHMATTLRTELFAVFFILLALLPPVIWPRHLPWATFGGGLLIALALLTKVQGLPLMALVICFYTWQILIQPEPQNWNLRRSWGMMGGACVLLVLMASFSWGETTLPGRVAQVTQFQNMASLKVPLVWLGLFALPPVALLLQSKIPPPLRPVAILLPCLFGGLALGLALPLLAYFPDFNHGWAYMRTLLQAILWSDLSATEAASLVDTLRFAWQHRWDYLLVLVGGLFLLATDAYKQHGSWRQIPLSDGALVAVILSAIPLLFLGNRALLRDTVWYEWWGLVVTLLLVGRLLSAPLIQNKKAYRMVMMALPFAMAVNSVSQASNHVDTSYLSNAGFGFDGAPYDYFWVNSVYLRDPQNPYAQLMGKAYDNNVALVRQALAQARHWESHQRWLDAPFINLALPAHSIGTVAKGFPVFRQGKEWARIEATHAQLEGQPLINPARLLLPSKTQHYVAHQLPNSPYLGQFTATGGSLNLLPAFHQQVLIVFSERDWVKFTDKKPSKVPDVVLQVADQKRPYYCFAIVYPTELTPQMMARLQDGFFFIVRTEDIQPASFPLWKTAGP